MFKGNITFFWAMKFHIELVDAIIYGLHSVVTHHSTEKQKVP